MYLWLICILNQPILDDYAGVVLAGLNMDDQENEPYAVYVGRSGLGDFHQVVRVAGNVPGFEEDQYLLEAALIDNGKVQTALQDYEVLVIQKGGIAIWEPFYPEIGIPEEAVKVGQNKDKNDIYIGRIQDLHFPGTTVTGTVDSVKKTFSFAEKDGNEHICQLNELVFGELEILTVVSDPEPKN